MSAPACRCGCPRAARSVEELEKLAKETEFAAGYVRVQDAAHRQGEDVPDQRPSAATYAESMFPPMELTRRRTDRAEAAGALLPQGDELSASPPHLCGGAAQLPRFAVAPGGVRHLLPLRAIGELFGLMRVRSLNMNDAHIYCTEEQFAERVQRGERDVSEVFQDLRHREIRDALQHARRRKGWARNTSTNRSCGRRPRTWCARCSIESGINYRGGAPTRRRSTARRSTCRSGAPSAANSPSPPTRWISPCPRGSA